MFGFWGSGSSDITQKKKKISFLHVFSSTALFYFGLLVDQGRA